MRCERFVALEGALSSRVACVISETRARAAGSARYRFRRLACGAGIEHKSPRLRPPARAAFLHGRKPWPAPPLMPHATALAVDNTSLRCEQIARFAGSTLGPGDGRESRLQVNRREPVHSGEMTHEEMPRARPTRPTHQDAARAGRRPQQQGTRYTPVPSARQARRHCWIISNHRRSRTLDRQVTVHAQNINANRESITGKSRTSSPRTRQLGLCSQRSSAAVEKAPSAPGWRRGRKL